jgi:hypothetical protein
MLQLTEQVLQQPKQTKDCFLYASERVVWARRWGPGQDFAISREAVLRARPTLRALSCPKKGEMKRHVLKHKSPRIRGWISVNSILSIIIGRMQRTPAMRLPMSLARTGIFDLCFVVCQTVNHMP